MNSAAGWLIPHQYIANNVHAAASEQKQIHVASKLTEYPAALISPSLSWNTCSSDFLSVLGVKLVK